MTKIREPFFADFPQYLPKYWTENRENQSGMNPRYEHISWYSCHLSFVIYLPNLSIIRDPEPDPVNLSPGSGAVQSQPRIRRPAQDMKTFHDMSSVRQNFYCLSSHLSHSHSGPQQIFSRWTLYLNKLWFGEHLVQIYVW